MTTADISYDVTLSKADKETQQRKLEISVKLQLETILTAFHVTADTIACYMQVVAWTPYCILYFNVVVCPSYCSYILIRSCIFESSLASQYQVAFHISRSKIHPDLILNWGLLQRRNQPDIRTGVQEVRPWETGFHYFRSSNGSAAEELRICQLCFALFRKRKFTVWACEKWEWQFFVQLSWVKRWVPLIDSKKINRIKINTTCITLGHKELMGHSQWASSEEFTSQRQYLTDQE